MNTFYKPAPDFVIQGLELYDMPAWVKERTPKGFLMLHQNETYIREYGDYRGNYDSVLFGDDVENSFNNHDETVFLTRIGRYSIELLDHPKVKDKTILLLARKWYRQIDGRHMIFGTQLTEGIVDA